MAYNTARTVSRLDRRVKGSAITNGYAGTTLTFTLPYKIATDGSEGTLVVTQISTGLIVPSTQTSTSIVTVTGVPNTPADFYIGVLYTFRYRLSTVMIRQSIRYGEFRKEVDSRGRLIVRYIKLLFHDTTNLAVTVLLQGRTLKTYTYKNVVTPDVPGQFRVPVQGRNTTATIEFTDTSPGICYIDGLEWEGTHATSTQLVT
jgi:hypothetical protein